MYHTADAEVQLASRIRVGIEIVFQRVAVHWQDVWHRFSKVVLS